MNPQAQKQLDEDEVKYLLLSNDETERCEAANALFRTYGGEIMRYTEYHHPGLNEPDRHEVVLLTIERFTRLLPNQPDWLDRALKPQLLRVAYHVGQEKYRVIARIQDREQGDLLDSVADSVRGAEIGETWRQVADSSFGERVRREILATAASMKPRQRQIAFWFAEHWGLELSEKEAMDTIFRTTGERLTRDQYKRALDEVRKKLREPVIKLLMEEGKCPKSLTKAK